MGFHVRFRGFDRTEVVAALAKLAAENEEARREIERMGAEMDRLQVTVSEQIGNERHVQRVLVVASKVADEIRERAEEEARRIVRDAENRGQLLSERLREEARGIENQIEALLARRRDVEASMESFIKIISDELEHARRHQDDEPMDGALAPTG